jgi:hypothetical protein
MSSPSLKIEFSKISNLDEINLLDNSLVVLDIDETIFTHREINCNWWKDKITFYLQIYQKFELAQEHAYNDWKEFVLSTPPDLINPESFFNLLEKIKRTNSNLIFITARNKDLENLTIEHFKKIHQENLIPNIFYSKEKGLLLKDLLRLKYPTVSQIIFVDDLIENLYMVYFEIGLDKNLNLYQFIKE